MSIIKLPTYEDDEVKVFHPICENALNLAIKNLGLDSEFDVIHHEPIGSLVVDFVIVRKSTKKYILFIEVKRTPAAVSSTRYRIQAQSYVQEAISFVEKPYYLITNLEVLDLFKYDNSRPSVTQQIIEPSTIRVGTFSDNPNTFFQSLVESFEEIISIVINDQGTYKKLAGSFIPMIEEYKSIHNKWHQGLIVAGYEYIRGVLKASNRKINWKAALNYRNKPYKIVENLKTVNFNKLVEPPFPISNFKEIWNITMLEDLEELGQKTMSGDAMAEIIHTSVIAGREHEGLVPTDLELANVLAILSRYILGRDLRKEEIICDPAAGSGNLLASSISGFDKIIPKQLWANDKEVLFSELLSIRLGLLFPAIVSPNNSPIVTTKDVIHLNKQDFENVKVVLMNPPYVSGVKDPKTKRVIASRIFDINEEKSQTYVGQVGVEAPFLELINGLVKEGTVIGVVFPKQYLTTNGREASSFRKFLLTNFGLNLIFLYPREGIFQEVIKDTVVLIGVKGTKAEKIQIVKSDIPLSEINLTKLKKGLEKFKQDNSINDITYGIEIRQVEVSELERKIKTGWRNLTEIGESVEKWVEDTLTSNSKYLSCVHKLRRGRIGNAGASDLLFINTNNKFWNKVRDIVPKEWLYPALRTVKDTNSIFINSKTTDIKFLSPSEEAFVMGTREYRILEEILDKYMAIQQVIIETTKQRKKLKSKEELRKIINRERKKISDEYTILIPRNIRRYARVFITTEKAYISTNVIEVIDGTEKEKWLTLSWLLSIFSQLQFEGMSKDQEGTRKLEEESIGKLLIPNIELINNDIILKLIELTKNRTEFMDLCNPKITEIDKLWAEVFNNPKEILYKTLTFLKEKVNDRYPEYSVDSQESHDE